MHCERNRESNEKVLSLYMEWLKEIYSEGMDCAKKQVEET